MNGVTSKELVMSTTHVVAIHTLTPKCREAFKHGTPVMTPEWVKAVWEESKKSIVDADDPKYEKYKCKILHNVQISISQVASNLKAQLQKKIRAAGLEQYTCFDALYLQCRGSWVCCFF